MWGFLGNSIVVFAAKELDFLVLINYIIYYILISYIVNRKKYETMLGKFIVLPGSAAIGAFTGYKLAQIIAQTFQKMKEWNPNDYQGRSRDQVERNYRAFAIFLALSWLVGTGIVLYKIIDYIF